MTPYLFVYTISYLLTIFEDIKNKNMHIARAVLINGVLTVLGFIFVVVFMVSCGITIEHVVKRCRSRRRRNEEMFTMSTINHWNDEHRRQSRIRHNIPDISPTIV